MPWKECSKMDERMKFVARLIEGEKMAVLCREYDISRKTGYKIWNRYQSCGVKGLTDRSRCPRRYANQLPIQVEKYILRIKKEKPNWGAPKIQEKLRRKYSDVKTPAKSTIYAILDRNGLANKKRSNKTFWNEFSSATRKI